MRPRLSSRLGLGFFGWVVLTAGGVAWCSAQEPAPSVAAEPVIELPKFEVNDSRLLPDQQKWTYASLPGFEVLSSISKRETTRFVKDFFLLQAGINEIMPGFATADVAVPTRLILTGRGKDFDRFLPSEQEEARMRTNGLFFDDPERSAIVVDFALAELTLEDSTTAEADPYREFYKNYFRYLIRRQMGGKPPPWFEEGLVQLFAAIDVNKKYIMFAQIGDGFGGEKTGDFNHLLNQRGLMKFPLLFAATPQRSTVWSAQCYAFVHMCLYGRGQKYQKGFLKFLGRISREEPNEAIFQECFGMNYDKMLLEVRGYIGFTDYKAQGFKAKKGQSLPDAPPFTLRDATDAESGRIVGEVLRLGQHGAEAHNALIAPYIRGERDPQLLAALGLDEGVAGNDERARKFLEAASAAKVERPRAYLELARLRLADAKAKPAGSDAEKLSAAQVARVLEPLLVARKQRPPMAAVYAVMAETWTRSEKAPTREEFIIVVEGAQTFYRNSSLVLQVTLLAAAHNFPKEALALAQHGQKISKNAAERMQFEMLVASFQRDADPAAAKPAAPEAPKPTESYLPKLP